MYKILDLFCGAGGFGLGFKQAGFQIPLSIDFNKHAVATHAYNFPDVISLQADLTQVSASDVIQSHNINPAEITGIIGGPPCQGFSIAGKRMIDDPRNKLFKEFVKFVEYIKPSFFLMENVTGLLSMNNGTVKDEIIELFSELGYNVDVKVLVATDYGVAQIRKRVFFMGFLDKQPSFPKPTVDTPKTVWDVIHDLPALELGEGAEELVLSDGTVVYNHYAFPLRELNRERIKHIPEGGGYDNLPEHLMRKVRFGSAYRRLDRYKPSYTIHTHFRDEFLTHPLQDRVITVREAARIQSFPDDFKFIGPKSRDGQFGQVGNAVPPLLAQALAEHILKILQMKL